MAERPQNDNRAMEAPTIEEQDWEAIEGAEILTEETPSNGDMRHEEPNGELPEEDDDNAYQDSDEALPDDSEEEAISRDPGRESGLFDEI